MQKKLLSELLLFCFILCIYFYNIKANAFEEYYLEYELPDEEFLPIEVTGDAISWEVFATTKEELDCFTDEDGFEYCTPIPKYSDEVRKLDKKEVTLMGYMFPLEQSDAQKNFLIGPYPLSGPFHYHPGPSEVVEVLADEPIEFSYGPVTVKGKLSVRFNKETGVFYYLENASN